MMLIQPGTLLQYDWYKSWEGRESLLSILHRNMHHRKLFGLLEEPLLPVQFSSSDVQYKIFVSGRSGVGKTSALAKLSGNEVPTMHSETPGIQTQVVYWPAKLVQTNKIVMFRLHFWDAGDAALKKFDHILPACKENADAVVFHFSFTDRGSFEDLPRHMARIVSPSDNTCKLVLGTKYDQLAHSDVTHQELREFEQQYKIPVLKIANIANYEQSELQTEVHEVAPVLNTLCEYLWRRDQVAAGVLQTERQTDEQRHSDEDQMVLYF
ncbi:PREDICTED: REM2- and Rab-like small GTPase 1 isoform X2 [Priapulus caudatus]|uniref:Ciliogenesis and planar polarity effector 2 n=1 Tax=Priapulus caudatus TaxID=37621 RepID=A0ABM1DYJ5_PRICU|nr:PREDICTED: REM2- and Rab-like small GTPase 1 isoform X2 [Priapulus caudatus]